MPWCPSGMEKRLISLSRFIALLHHCFILERGKFIHSNQLISLEGWISPSLWCNVRVDWRFPFPRDWYAQPTIITYGDLGIPDLENSIAVCKTCTASYIDFHAIKEKIREIKKSTKCQSIGGERQRASRLLTPVHGSGHWSTPRIDVH